MPNEKGSLQGRKNIDCTGMRTRMQVDRAGFEPASISLSNLFGFACLLILIPVVLLLVASYKFSV